MFVRYIRPFVMVYTNEEGLEDAISIRAESEDVAKTLFEEGYQDCVLNDIIDIYSEMESNVNMEEYV